MVRVDLADVLVLLFFTIHVSCRSLIEMTESKAETAPKPAKELLALNPKQESEFKKKVQEAKKNKSSKVGRDEKCGTERTTNSRCESVFMFLFFFFSFFTKVGV